MSLPNAFPKEAGKVLLSLITGSNPSTSEIITAVYEVAGYGLFLAFGDGVPLIADDAETVEIKTALTNPENQQKLAAALPPFVVNLLILAIQKIVERLAK